MTKNKLIMLLALTAVGYACYCQVSKDCPSCPAPPPPVKPAPTPPTKPSPKPRRPWGPNPCPPGQEAGSLPAEGVRPQEGGRVSPDGTEEMQVDLPESERKPNISSKGLGCCVFRSCEYGGRWGHEPELYNLPERMRAAGVPGGGYPDKLDQVLARFAPHVKYGQSTARDMALLRAVLASGRMAMVDYNGHDCHYPGGIAHMVSVTHASEKWVAVSDNNFVKENQFVWMSPDEFQKRWGGWLVWLMAPPPPPVPHNAEASICQCQGQNRCGCFVCQCQEGHRCPDSGCNCNREGIGGPVYEWRPVAGDSTQVALFLAGRQVGNYSYLWKVYRPLEADGTWGDPCDPPSPPPGVEPPTGVEADKIGPPRYLLNGHRVSRDQALDAVRAGTVPDDARLPYLTIIGTEDKTGPVLADLNADPRLAALKGRYKVNIFTPAEWQVAEGFAHAGDVTVYLESADGRVLSRSDHYSGPAQLAKALNGALRKADPSYDPRKDPDLANPLKLPFDPSKVPPAVWVGGAFGLYLLTKKEKK